MLRPNSIPRLLHVFFCSILTIRINCCEVLTPLLAGDTRSDVRALARGDWDAAHVDSQSRVRFNVTFSGVADREAVSSGLVPTELDREREFLGLAMRNITLSLETIASMLRIEGQAAVALESSLGRVTGTDDLNQASREQQLHRCQQREPQQWQLQHQQQSRQITQRHTSQEGDPVGRIQPGAEAERAAQRLVPPRAPSHNFEDGELNRPVVKHEKEEDEMLTVRERSGHAGLFPGVNFGLSSWRRMVDKDEDGELQMPCGSFSADGGRDIQGNRGGEDRNSLARGEDTNRHCGQVPL